MIERKIMPDDVKWGFRLLLGRDPENFDVISQYVLTAMTQREFVCELLQSEEFKTKFGHVIEVVQL